MPPESALEAGLTGTAVRPVPSYPPRPPEFMDKTMDSAAGSRIELAEPGVEALMPIRHPREFDVSATLRASVAPP